MSSIAIEKPTINTRDRAVLTILAKNPLASLPGWYNVAMPSLQENIEHFIDKRLEMFRPTDVCWLKKMLEHIASTATETEHAILHLIAIACPIFPDDGAIDVLVTQEYSPRAITHSQIIRTLTGFLSQYNIDLQLHFSVSNIQPLVYPLAYDACVAKAAELRAQNAKRQGLLIASELLSEELAAATMDSTDPRFKQYQRFLREFIFDKSLNDLVFQTNTPNRVKEKVEESTFNTINLIEADLNDHERASVNIVAHPDQMATILGAEDYLSQPPMTILIELMKKLAQYDSISWDGTSNNDYDHNSFLNALYILDMISTTNSWVGSNPNEGTIWINLMSPSDRQSNHIQTLLADPAVNDKISYPVIRSTGSHTKQEKLSAS